MERAAAGSSLPVGSRDDRPGPTDADLRVLDAVLAMLAAGRTRLETDDRGAALDYVGWARDLLTQLLSTPPAGSPGRPAGSAARHRERLAVAHRDLARAACEGDAAVIAEVAEFLEAVRRASGPAPSALRAPGSSAA